MAMTKQELLDSLPEDVTTLDIIFAQPGDATPTWLSWDIDGGKLGEFTLSHAETFELLGFVGATTYAHRDDFDRAAVEVAVAAAEIEMGSADVQA